MPSRPSASDSPFGSYAMTTRSGRYPAIASTFGVKPESAVFGALFGKSDWSSTATTCGPAPIAKSVSVAVGESETMRLGRFVTVTSPLEPTTVTGNAVGATAPPEAPATVSARAAAAAPARTRNERST